MKESQAHAGVLLEHQARQQVLAEAMKRMIVWQHQGQPPQQGDTGTNVVVTDVDEDDGTRLDFSGWYERPWGTARRRADADIDSTAQRPNNAGVAKHN